MEFNLIVSPRAQRELNNAINYYSGKSLKATKNFIDNLEKSYINLRINPFYGTEYKDIRAYMIPKYPYKLYYKTDDPKN